MSGAGATCVCVLYVCAHVCTGSRTAARLLGSCFARLPGLRLRAAGERWQRGFRPRFMQPVLLVGQNGPVPCRAPARSPLATQVLKHSC